MKTRTTNCECNVKRNQLGFTLIELLIVVGIIGVLSTVGIPTFKKMVQKSKKSEAKTALAGLFTAQIGFQAEYSTFANRLDKVGFEINGNTQTYTLGFPSTACESNTIAPATGTSAGDYLNSVYTGYFSVATVAHSSIVEAVGARKPTACEAGDISADGRTFKATANGAISPSANVGQKADLDVWTLNENRALINTIDGVR